MLRLLTLISVLVAGPCLARQAAPPTTTGSESVLNPDKGNAGDAAGRAVTRPLRDLNLIKPKIAPGLTAIMANPYAIKALRNCRQLNNEVHRMTALVGPDVDDPALIGKKGRTPPELLLDSAEGLTGSLVPGQSIIRQLTGANKAARQAAAARLAGQLRRAHIKGAMKARGCRLSAPPASSAIEPAAKPARQRR
jgi:hypothetical protein